MIEVARPFEPRSGAILIEQPLLFCGVLSNSPDAFVLMNLVLVLAIFLFIEYTDVNMLIG